MAGNFSRSGVSGRNVVYRHAKPAAEPPVRAGDPDYERDQPVTRDDRRALLRRHFAASGMSESEIDAAMNAAKV